MIGTWPGLVYETSPRVQMSLGLNLNSLLLKEVMFLLTTTRVKELGVKESSHQLIKEKPFCLSMTET